MVDDMKHEKVSFLFFHVFFRFEKMAESCKKSMEVLKLAQSRGLPPPKHHFEEKSFRIAKWEHLPSILYSC